MQDAMAVFNPAAAISTLLRVASDVNTYIESNAPWALAKDPDKKKR